MKLVKSIVFVSVIILLSFTTRNDSQQWILIGEKRASFLIDHDVIHVTGNDNYRQLKVKVKDGPVHVIDLDVHFENGDKFDVALKQRIPKGGESRVIDLPGNSRSIRKVEFWYETKGFRKGRGTVQVWGKR